MLGRALLLGVLAIAAGSCGSKDVPAAADTAVAGQVVEVAGVVTVRGKPLAAGDHVAGVDVIETGADGRVVIELAHNGARWQLGPNKRETVTESIAWTLPKRTGETKAVQQDTAAAGRPAERNAAETGATAPAPPEAEIATESKAAAPAPSRRAPRSEPPPPSPPAVQPIAPRANSGAAIGGAAIGGAAKGAADPATAALRLIEPHRAELAKCLRGAASLTLHVAADGSATATPSKPASAAAQACVARVLAKIHFAPGPLDVELK